MKETFLSLMPPRVTVGRIEEEEGHRGSNSTYHTRDRDERERRLGGFHRASTHFGTTEVRGAAVTRVPPRREYPCESRARMSLLRAGGRGPVTFPGCARRRPRREFTRPPPRGFGRAP